jgi:hypothetical protein
MKRIFIPEGELLFASQMHVLEVRSVRPADDSTELLEGGIIEESKS